VVGVWAERLPTRGIDGGRRWLPRRLGGNGEEGAGLGNTRPRKVHWGLGKLMEWFAGDKRERGARAQGSGGGNGGGGSSVARGGEEDSA
jgi:hypothetical protein